MHQRSCLTRSSEHTPSLNPQKQAAVALIRSAARDAVHAATPEQAADIAFAALVEVYAITQAEQSPAIAIGQKCLGGRFVGLNNRSEAVILLPDDLEAVNFHEATEWADSIGGDLPTRAELSLLFANFPRAFARSLYWSCERETDRYAWYGSFVTGRHYYCLQRRPINACAIRRVSINEVIGSPRIKARDSFAEQASVIQSARQVRFHSAMRTEVAHG